MEFRVLESNATHTIVEIEIPPVETETMTVDGRDYDLVLVPGAYPYGDPGEPLLAVDAAMIAVPPAAGVELRILEESTELLRGYDLPPVSAVVRVPPEPVVIDEDAYAHAGFSPDASVTVGNPAIMRDFRVVPLRVYPLAYDPSTREVRVTTRLVVELDYSGPGRVNVLTPTHPPTKEYAPLYEALIANYDFVRPRYESDERARYLIVTHDNYYDSILPLAEWKHRSGNEVEIAKLSQIGSSASQIRAYIQDAYDTWEVRPLYILLVGDTEQLPTSSGSDDYYAKLAGGDFIVDVRLGRLSCDSVSQCDLIVAKTLGYQRTPYMNDLDWFRSASLIINDDSPSDPRYWADSQHAEDLMLASGFVQVDWFVDTQGDDANDVHAAVTDGRVFVNYRGQGVSNWWPPFECNPNSTNPGYKLPVVMSATCGTGSFSYDGYPCETWMRAGSVANPRGSVAFVATSRVASHVSALRSVVNQNFYSAIFQYRMHTIGLALDYGKERFWLIYEDQYEYSGWNCQGDPALDVWTGVPQTLTASYPATVPPGQSTFVVEVESGGSPVADAAVCAWADGDVYATGLTTTAGLATLVIEPVDADTIWVTVSGHNLHPYEGHTTVIPEGPFLVYESHEIDDQTGGNGDGLVNPGEVVELTVSLENVGPDDALGVSGTLVSGDSYVTIRDAAGAYGDIPSGAVRPNTDSYMFEVREDCPNGHPLGFSITAGDAGRTTWDIIVPNIAVAAADLAHDGTVVNDGGSGGNGNGILEAGETAWLDIAIENAGAVDLYDVAGDLSTTDPYVVVTASSGTFGAILSGQSVGSEAPSFRVSVSPAAPPTHEVSFVLSTSGDAETYGHVEDVTFSLSLGGTATNGPCGPDGHGYYAYDATDTWSGQAPAYDWVELVGVGSLISAITNADAQTTTLSLPFTFQYYGGGYGQVSVCSNGFIAMGSTDYRLGDNSEIPSPHGPPSMIAPFWDDLDPSNGGDIYQWYDSANDDGIIDFQYQTVANIGQCTVGIENLAQNDGIEYVYFGSYNPCAAPITSGSAIRLTTEPPLAPPVWLALLEQEVDDTAGGDGDGLAEPSETIDLMVTLRNSGVATAEAVEATISTSDPDAMVVTGTATYGDIGPGSSSLSAAPFVITIGADPADDRVEFDVHISTGSRYDTWDVLTLVLTLDDTDVEDGDLITSFALRQNTPNPFRNGTTIAFDLPSSAHTQLEVYNVAGRKVASVIDQELSTGHHTVTWDGVDADGREVSAGIYFYRLVAGSSESTKKMILLK